MNKITPVGLKGREINERMKELMGITSINENKRTSVVELTKKGPDGKVYGIVRENHEYYIKVTNKTSDIVTEDFSYIGGLKNIKQEAYGSYAKALKHLNLKFNSLNEAYGVSENINVFEDDRLLKEDIANFYTPQGNGFSNEGNMDGHETSECCQAPVMEGLCTQCGSPSMPSGMDSQNSEMDIYNPITAAHSEYQSPHERMFNSDEFAQAQQNAHGSELDELDEFNQAVQDMMEEDSMPKPKPISLLPMHENKLSIARSINIMDDVIDSLGKKKILKAK